MGSGAGECAASLGLVAAARVLPLGAADADVDGADAILVAGGFESERHAASALLPGP